MTFETRALCAAVHLFAITEGFVGPLYFVWLGASLDRRALGSHPNMVVLGFGAIAVHGALRLTGRSAGLGYLRQPRWACSGRR
ncbi:hypothetical protein CH275_18430 [Rhodococcus sp. 06-235-1A]|uniref:hypothetical protein n=1 Tax=Rhodococcus sp. 06-235-1A TaxID=2022508 RepID=UPI000B9C61FA|nr:hypothetical protein [Rhodococcus sp. 06-235-1A]OZD01780.1 hypothetical protein CH275_18430 [Rhodococcus sp. 06-235-1A]